MTDTETYKYSVGTAETGSFFTCGTLLEAQTEARDWAQSEPGLTVYVWAVNDEGGVIDAVDDYCF